MSEQKYGVVRSWNPEKDYGVVWISRSERYLLHIVNVPEPDVPVDGQGVSFDVAPPFIAGHLPQCKNVKLVPLEPVKSTEPTKDGQEGGR